MKKVLDFERIVPPSMRYKVIGIPQFKVIHQRSIRDLANFWGSEASRLTWVKKWDSVIVGSQYGARWFVGGLIDAYHNIVGKHKSTWVWDKPAIIWESEDGVAKVFTYSDLNNMVIRYSMALRGLGVKPGDWVMFYAPPLPEVIALALASVRLGAPFEFVFTGFGAMDLARRVIDRRPKVLVTVDAFPRRGKPITVKSTVDKALGIAKASPRVIIISRMGVDVNVVQGRDSFIDEVPTADPGEDYVAESTHPLFGLHAGYDDDIGLITHGVGGYLVQTYSTTRWMGLRPHDTYFCTVLPGWITGITYVIFGPFMIGSTVVLYEGGPDYPHWDRWWSILERYAVTVFLTTSAALRLLSRQDPDLLMSHNLDMLRLILTTAEPLESSIWRWTYQYVGTGTVPTIDSLPGKLSGRIPVVHMFIQSELGTFVTGSLPNYTFVPLTPGSVGPPMPGFDIDVVNADGNPVRDSVGYMVIKSPWPAMPIEYTEHYVRKWVNGVYFVGDYAVMNRDMYIYPLGRVDGVMKVNGYRISPGEVERAIESLPWVRRAVVAGMLDELKFESPIAVVEGSGGSQDEVRRVVRELVGPIAEPAKVIIVNELPGMGKDELRRMLKEHLWGLRKHEIIERLLRG